ncbi:MAG: hypothetical protein SFW35_11655 [Chitinophagales bacterium]|nr:hypothetical protein [Chitinophagales bacterium]
MEHKTDSLDPRIQRLELPQGEVALPNDEYWGTFEVFHQEKTGKRYTHVGSVHAPDAEIALLFAKEQFGRRGTTINLWVVKTSDIYSFQAADEDMFATTPEKQHREAGIYNKVRSKIDAYQARTKPAI